MDLAVPGAITSMLLFVLTLIIEWPRLTRYGARRLLVPALVGALMLFVGSALPIFVRGLGVGGPTQSSSKSWLDATALGALAGIFSFYILLFTQWTRLRALTWRNIFIPGAAGVVSFAVLSIVTSNGVLSILNPVQVPGATATVPVPTNTASSRVPPPTDVAVAPTRIPTETTQPATQTAPGPPIPETSTYIPQPTYTPLPTLTPYPTNVPPTLVRPEPSPTSVPPPPPPPPTQTPIRPTQPPPPATPTVPPSFDAFAHQPGGTSYTYPEEGSLESDGTAGWTRIRRAVNGEFLPWTFFTRIRCDRVVNAQLTWEMPTVLKVHGPMRCRIELRRDLGSSQASSPDNPDTYAVANAKKSLLGLSWYIRGQGTVTVNGEAPIQLANTTVRELDFPHGWTGVWTLDVEVPAAATLSMTQGEKPDEGTRAFTNERLNGVFGQNNWFCFPDTGERIGVRKLPPDFFVSGHLPYVETYIKKYHVGEISPDKLGATVGLDGTLPRAECPPSQRNALAEWDARREPLTRNLLDSKLGIGNWTCIAGFPSAAIVEPLPTNMRVEYPFTTIDYQDYKYGVGEAVPGGSKATVWMRDSIPKDQCFTLVTLQGVAQNQVPEKNGLGLEPGKQNLLDIPFETGWTLTTQNSKHPDYPTLVSLDVSISHPKSIHMLIQAGWAYAEFKDKQVAVLSLRFADGNVRQVPLVLGENIRDWSRDDPRAVGTVTSPMIREAYQGIAPPPDGRKGGIDLLTIGLSQEEMGSTLVGISIDDTTETTAGSVNPAVHLLALTVQHQP